MLSVVAENIGQSQIHEFSPGVTSYVPHSHTLAKQAKNKKKKYF